MRDFTLTASQRSRLAEQFHAIKDERVRQRIRAVLQASHGRPISKIAKECQVSRQSVYNWIEHYTRERSPKSLLDRKRPGRPTVWTQEMLELVRKAMNQSPEAVGIAGKHWRTPQVRQYLEKITGRRLSRHTVRQGMNKAGFVWKRTRFVPVAKGKASKSKPAKK